MKIYFNYKKEIVEIIFCCKSMTNWCLKRHPNVEEEPPTNEVYIVAPDCVILNKSRINYCPNCGMSITTTVQNDKIKHDSGAEYA